MSRMRARYLDKDGCAYIFIACPLHQPSQMFLHTRKWEDGLLAYCEHRRQALKGYEVTATDAYTGLQILFVHKKAPGLDIEDIE